MKQERKMESETGKITTWNDEKGFGFITSIYSGKQIFIHINEFSKEHKRPVQGLSVTFQRKIDPRGRQYASNVHPLRGHIKVNKAEGQLLFSIIFSSAFFIIIGILVAINK